MHSDQPLFREVSNYVAGRHSIRLLRWPSFFRTLPLKSDAISIGYLLWKGCKVSEWRLRERLDFSHAGSFCCWHVGSHFWEPTIFRIRLFGPCQGVAGGSTHSAKRGCCHHCLPNRAASGSGSGREYTCKIWQLAAEKGTSPWKWGRGIAWCWSKHLPEQELFIYSHLQSWYKDRYIQGKA